MTEGPAPTVSVILPVFNGGSQLHLAVASIIEQTFVDWELIVLDDGSTDRAVAELMKLGDSRLRILRDESRHGLSSRLNQGVMLARGRYIARMDHDDVAHPERLARQVRLLDDSPEVDLCGSRCMAMDHSGGVLGTLPVALTHQEICARPWRGFHLAHPTWTGRAEWFRENPYKEPGPFRCEDQELLLRTHTTSCFGALAESLLCYRVRPNPNLSTLSKTRVAMASEQVRYFWSRRQFQSAALSMLLALVRFLGDLVRVAAGVHTPVRALASKAEKDEWENIIKACQAGLRVSPANEQQSSPPLTG